MKFETLLPLLRVLADGQIHSGEALGMACGISRAAVWKQVQALNRFPGIHIHSIKGRGYRLQGQLHLLDEALLQQKIDPGLLGEWTMLPSIKSTNQYLLEQAAPAPGNGCACIAEHQIEGRGRRGRTWVSLPGQSIIFSLSWGFELPLRQLSGVSIMAGCVIAEALARHGLHQVAVKWPNDILLADRKLAGILVEARGEVEGPANAIIGLGLNYGKREDMADIDQPWTALSEHIDDQPERNQLVADLLMALAKGCSDYQEFGLSAFITRWSAFDAYRNRTVTMLSANETVTGQYRGIAEDGSLVLDCGEKIRHFHAGEVSLRGARKNGDSAG